MGDPEHRLLLRRARGFGGRRGSGGGASSDEEEVAPGVLDVFVVPVLLLLVARDLLVRDPPRVLAWRLLHEPGLAAMPAFARWLPSPAGDVDRDPIALVLAALATLLAAVYVGGAILGKGERFRAGVMALAALVVVVLPSSAFMAMGGALGRPYGQDGGVVQLPLAMDKILAGQSPYDTDYARAPDGQPTVLAREVRTSRQWGSAAAGGPEYGENPLLHHHAYLPGTHLLMLPFHLAARAAGATFDPRVVTLAAYFAAALLAARLARRAALTAAALVLLNPLVYWHQIFGANDIVFVAILLGAALLLPRRPLAAAALIGLACATKQLAWPFAPFLLVAGAGDFRAAPRAAFVRLAKMTLAAATVFAAIVLPIAARDFHAFYVDIFGYNVGLPGVTNYPLGGTPGFGFANFLIYAGAVRSLGEYFPFSIFYVLLVPLVLLLLRDTLRRAEPAQALAVGAAALLASLYFARIVHPNYMIPVATLLPVALLAGARLRADAAVVPLVLLAAAVEIAERSPLRLLWDEAVAARFPQHAAGLVRGLLPRCGPALTDDPLSLVWSAVAAGLATAYLVAAILGLRLPRATVLVAVAAGLVVMAPLYVVVTLGERTVVRAQDEWVVEVRGAAQTLAAGGHSASAPWAREAVSTSFRGEPARRLSAERGPMPAGPAGLSALLRLVGAVGDPRVLCALAVLLLVGLVGAAAPPPCAPWLLAMLVLAPPAVNAVVFGGPWPIALAGLAAVFLAKGWRTRAFGLALAVSSAISGGLAALPLALQERGAARVRLAGALGVGAILGYGAVMVVGVGAGLLQPGPGLGLVNLWLYFGRTPGPATLAILTLAALALTFALLRRVAAGELEGGVAAAMIALLMLVVAPSGAPDAVLIPIGLLALTAAGQEEISDEPLAVLAT